MFDLENNYLEGVTSGAAQEWDPIEMWHLKRMPGIEQLGIEGWNEASLKDKCSVMQNLVNRCTEIHGMEPVPLEFGNPGKGNAGIYSQDTRRITLDQKDLENCNTIKELSHLRNTVLHETFHAYQHQCIEGKIQHSNPTEVEVWRENFKNYITPDEDIVGYWNQPVEVSARIFAEVHNKQIAELNGETWLNTFTDHVTTSAVEFLENNRSLWYPVMRMTANAIKNMC